MRSSLSEFIAPRVKCTGDPVTFREPPSHLGATDHGRRTKDKPLSMLGRRLESQNLRHLRRHGVAAEGRGNLHTLHQVAD